MNILIKNIKPNEYNPNEMTESEFAELVQEVKHLGKPPKPIVLRNKGEFFEIVDGEHSYRALKELGIEELKETWFELVNYDDIEAKRQTYKRNLGGTNNPVRLGQMFKQVLEASDMSNRQLAEQWGLSEGTIRNYLMYATASKLRNDYANLAKLSKAQIKLYLQIAEYAKPIADYWLSCGALEDALIWFSDAKFIESTEQNPLMKRVATSFIEIMSQGSEKLLTYKTDFIPFDLTPENRKQLIQKFKNGIKTALKMAHLKKRMEESFNLGDNTNQKVAEYLDLYFTNPLALSIPENQRDVFFSIIIKKTDGKLEFLLTPEELKQCMKLQKGESYHTVISRIRLLAAEKHKLAPSEIKEYSGGGIERHLDNLEIEKNAPDYVKQTELYLPSKFKLAFLELNFEDEQLRKSRWELLLKKYSLSYFIKIDHQDQSAFKREMLAILEATKKREQLAKENEELRQKSETELAELFVEKISGLFKGNEDDRKILIEKMVSTFSKEFLHLFVYLTSKYYEEKEYQARYKELVNQARASGI